MAYGGMELERFVDAGETIVSEGDDSREMFVIQYGRVAITKRVRGKQVVLATLEKGDFFGEMSLLESLPRDADARAEIPTKLLVIQPGGLLLRIRRDPTFAFEMLTRLSSRLRRQNARLVRAIEARGQIATREILLHKPDTLTGESTAWDAAVDGPVDGDG